MPGILLMWSHSILPAVPMKGRRLTFAKYLTMYQALCMELLYTSWGKNYHPHFRDEGKWGSETLNSLPQKQQSQNQGSCACPKDPHSPNVPLCCQVQSHSKNLVRKIWVPGLPFAMMPRGLAVFSKTVDEACCCFKCSVKHKQHNKK